MDNIYCVIMAGGVGTRLWPLSRRVLPKQFIDVLGTGRTLLQQTYDRFSAFIAPENFLVVTTKKYKALVLEQLPELNDEQVLSEPFRRNTAPCAAYAAYKIKSRCSSAKIIVTPSDHIIFKLEEFKTEIGRALEFAAENDALVTLGIKPVRPDQGFGYIQIKNNIEFKSFTNLYKVKTFTEKPDREMAKVFIETGEFFWNSGIFIWSLQSFIKSLETCLPDIAALFAKGKKLYNTPYEVSFINKTYSECRGISLDYGILEKAENVYVLTSDFGWSDLGTWNSLYEIKEKDVNRNMLYSDNVLTYNTTNCIIKVCDGRIAVVHGLEGYIVAESNDFLLICRRDEENLVKQFVTDVRIKKGDSLV